MNQEKDSFPIKRQSDECMIIMYKKSNHMH